MLDLNLRRSETFETTVIPFHQIAIGLGNIPEAGQFAGASRALQGAGENFREVQPGQSFSKEARIVFTTLCERNIGQARMLASKAPGGFPVACQIYHWEGATGLAPIP